MNSINPLNPRTAEIILLQGDDQAELDRLDAEVERLAPTKGKPSAARTADEVDPYTEAKDARNAFAVKAEARGVKVILRALGRKTWRELVAKHQPREGHAADAAVGVNEETFPDVLVPASIASPTFTSDVERDAFLDSLYSIQFDELYFTAFRLNRQFGADPKDARL